MADQRCVITEKRYSRSGDSCRNTLYRIEWRFCRGYIFVLVFTWMLVGACFPDLWHTWMNVPDRYVKSPRCSHDSLPRWVKAATIPRAFSWVPVLTQGLMGYVQGIIQINRWAFLEERRLILAAGGRLKCYRVEGIVKNDLLIWEI